MAGVFPVRDARLILSGHTYSGIFLIFGRLGAKTHTNQRQDSEYFKNRLVDHGLSTRIAAPSNWLPAQIRVSGLLRLVLAALVRI